MSQGILTDLDLFAKLKHILHKHNATESSTISKF